MQVMAWQLDDGMELIWNKYQMYDERQRIGIEFAQAHLKKYLGGV